MNIVVIPPVAYGLRKLRFTAANENGDMERVGSATRQGATTFLSPLKHCPGRAHFQALRGRQDESQRRASHKSGAPRVDETAIGMSPLPALSFAPCCLRLPFHRAHVRKADEGNWCQGA